MSIDRDDDKALLSEWMPRLQELAPLDPGGVEDVTNNILSGDMKNSDVRAKLGSATAAETGKAATTVGLGTTWNMMNDWVSYFRNKQQPATSTTTDTTTPTSGGAKNKASAAAGPAAPATPVNPPTPVTASVSPVANLYQKNAADKFGLLKDTGMNAEDAARSTELMEMMSQTAKSMLRGELPADVQAQVERRSAEMGLRGGLGAGSPASRARTARDLGLTSLDLQQRGAAIGEVVSKLSEARREYNKTLALNTQQLMDSVRRTDLSALDLRERSRIANQANREAATTLLTNTIMEYHRLAYNYAANKDADMASGTAASEDIAALLTNILRPGAGLR